MVSEQTYLQLGLISNDVEVGPLLAEEQRLTGATVQLRRLFTSQTCPNIWVVGTKTPGASNTAPLP